MNNNAEQISTQCSFIRFVFMIELSRAGTSIIYLKDEMLIQYITPRSISLRQRIAK